MNQTRDQKRFTISEVAGDWHELMIPQRTMRPSIARVGEQLDPRFVASRHATAPISHTIGLHPVACKLLLISRPADGIELVKVWIRTLSMPVSMNGESICVPVFAQRADISNIYCKQLDNGTIGQTVSQSDRNLDKMCFMRVF